MSLAVTQPNQADMLRGAMRRALYEARTCIPARVERVRADEQAVDVQPLVRDRVSDGAGGEIAETGPVITRVPIQFMRWGGFVIRCSIAVGDIVTLSFADRSLETWLSGDGSLQDSPSRRAHDLSDAIATPGVSPWGAPVSGLADGALVIGREDGGGELRINADGSIAIGPATGQRAAAAREGDATIVDGGSDDTFIRWLLALHSVIAKLGLLTTPPLTPVGATTTDYLAQFPTPPTTIAGRINDGSGNVEIG